MLNTPLTSHVLNVILSVILNVILRVILNVILNVILDAEIKAQRDMVRSHSVLVWSDNLPKKSLVGGGEWQTKFNV